MNLNSRYPTFRTFGSSALKGFNSLKVFYVPSDLIYAPCQLDKK